MSRDPFRTDGPTCISFSGGRTSAYMLWRVIQSHEGTLPDDCIVCFANTGKEDEETLRFVRKCSIQWGVPITWLEYRDDDKGYAVVDYETASRNGEPFEAIVRKRNYLPNPVARFCTVELKIRTMHKHLKYMGWADNDGWNQFVGIRADEQRRASKIRARPSPETSKETMCIPLADAGITVRDVQAFWIDQPFNLQLPTYNGRTLAGNCDLCFLKPAAQVASLIAENPARAIWWAKIETLALSLASKPSGARFRSDRPSYAQMLSFTQAQSDAFGHAAAEIDDGIECVGCTD